MSQNVEDHTPGTFAGETARAESPPLGLSGKDTLDPLIVHTSGPIHVLAGFGRVLPNGVLLLFVDQPRRRDVDPREVAHPIQDAARRGELPAGDAPCRRWMFSPQSWRLIQWVPWGGTAEEAEDAAA